MKAQTYINQKYQTKEQKKEVKELDLRNLNLEGDLDFADFDNLKEIDISGNPKLGKMTANGDIWWWTKFTAKISAQEWLNKKYPYRQQVKEIKLEKGIKFNGELTINDFSQLERIIIDNLTTQDLSELQVSNCPNLNKICCFDTQFTSLKLSNLRKLTEVKFGKNNLTLMKLDIETCPNLKELEIKYSQLVSPKLSNVYNLENLNLSCNSLLSKLDLSGAPNLKVLNLSQNSSLNNLNNLINLQNNQELVDLDVSCTNLTHLNLNHLKKLKWLTGSRGQLTTLSVSGCSDLRGIECWNNLLTDLDLNNNSQLGWLDVRGNNFSKQDLTFLSRLVNLRGLKLGNWDDRKKNLGVSNRFYGSLEPLKNLTKLEHLSVVDTDVDGGLEYLPSSLKSFSGLGEEIEGENFSEKLRDFKTRIENKLKTELEESKKQWKENLELFLKIQNKKKELKRLKAAAKNKLENNQKSFLNDLLVSQEQIILMEGNNAQLINAEEAQLNEAKEKLKERISQEEINNLCQKKIELTKLEIKLEQLKEQEFEAKQEVSPLNH